MLRARQGDFGLRHHLGPISFLVALTWLAAIPVFRFGIPYGFDAAEHLSWYRCFIAQLGSGELHPQWLQGMNAGLGSPDLFVYGPLPYYAAALFRPFTGPGREMFDLGLSMVLALTLAGVAAYFWLGQLASGRLVPAVGAVVYLAVPYVLKTDFYTRVAVAEFWTFAWMPLILYFTSVLLRARSPGALAGLAACWGLLFTTHLFTAMLFAPVALVYAGWLASPRQRAPMLLTATIGMLLGAALSAFYLFPALSCERYIPAYKLIQTRPNYRFERNFLFSNVVPTPFKPYLRALSRLTAWTIVVAATFAAAAFPAKSGRLFRQTVWWVIVAGGSFLLMLPISGWVWARVPLLAAIQFPSRFNTLLAVATAALAATGMESLRDHWHWRKAVLVGLALLLAAAWVRPLFYAVGDQHGQMQRLGSENLDYLITAWANWTDPKLLSLRGIPMDASAAKVVSPSGTTIVGRWEPRLIEFQTDSASETWVTVKQFYFPLWTAALSEGSPLALRPSTPEGLIEILVPAGAADVTLRLPRSIPEIAGVALSGVTAVGMILLVWRRATLFRQRSTDPIVAR
jgi:hypothetical protein